jgi:hypothetical protein
MAMGAREFIRLYEHFAVPMQSSANSAFDNDFAAARKTITNITPLPRSFIETNNHGKTV